MKLEGIILRVYGRNLTIHPNAGFEETNTCEKNNGLSLCLCASGPWPLSIKEHHLKISC